MPFDPIVVDASPAGLSGRLGTVRRRAGLRLPQMDIAMGGPAFLYNHFSNPVRVMSGGFYPERIAPWGDSPPYNGRPHPTGREKRTRSSIARFHRGCTTGPCSSLISPSMPPVSRCMASGIDASSSTRQSGESTLT